MSLPLWRAVFWVSSIALTVAASGCWLALGLENKEFSLSGSGSGGSGSGSGSGGSGAGSAGGARSAPGSCPGETRLGLPPAGICGEGRPPAMPIVSRFKPAYADPKDSPATRGNDTKYGSSIDALDSDWRTEKFAETGWLAYDLSSAPAEARETILAVFYNMTDGYDALASVDDSVSALPAAYRIEGNRAGGGTSDPPPSGWEVLARVECNTRHSRQHYLAFAGYQWIRIVVTAVDGNKDWVALDFDVHDASTGGCDDIILFGDAVIERGLLADRDDTLAARVGEGLGGDRVPLIELGGVRAWTIDDARKRILGDTGYLAGFPGRYVALAFGYQDAVEGGDPAAFVAILEEIVNAVIDSGKIPIVPRVAFYHAIDGDEHELRKTIDAMNERIEDLYTKIPAILHGPDLRDVIDVDLAPELLDPAYGTFTDEGRDAVMNAWAEALLEQVYGVTPK